MPPSRMVTSSRRAGRVTNKTKLLIYRGSDRVDLAHAEIIVWEQSGGGDHNGTAGGGNHGSGEKSDHNKSQHVGAIGVESGELLVSRSCSFILSYASRAVVTADVEISLVKVGGVWEGRGASMENSRVKICCAVE